MTLGEKIKKIREAKGFSQKQVGEQLGMTSQNYGKWETGKVDPPLSKLQTLATILGVSLESLLNDESNQKATIVSLINQKGGTGKTTIAIALATMHTHQQKAKVCIIDCDFQQSVVSYDELEKRQGVKPVVDVIPLPVHQTKRFILTFTELLEECKEKYDLVIIDTMGSFHDVETISSIISLSDMAIIPIEPTTVALQSSADSIELVQEVQQERKRKNKMPLIAKGIISKANQTTESKEFSNLNEIEGLEIFKNAINYLAVYNKELSLHYPIEHKNFLPVYKEFLATLSSI